MPAPVIAILIVAAILLIYSITTIVLGIIFPYDDFPYVMGAIGMCINALIIILSPVVILIIRHLH